MRGSPLAEVDGELHGGRTLFFPLLCPQCLEWGLAQSKSCQSLLDGQVKSQHSYILKEE